jgi:hypothetical protein
LKFKGTPTQSRFVLPTIAIQVVEFSARNSSAAPTGGVKKIQKSRSGNEFDKQQKHAKPATRRLGRAPIAFRNSRTDSPSKETLAKTPKKQPILGRTA